MIAFRATRSHEASDAELAVGAAVHMQPALSEPREDRLASGEEHVYRGSAWET
jgi:hypothetical protein